ncbi:MAG: helix-turn-helix domain-containing protein [Coriobacteriia bacterium]|nr:helix-turn-helix domain-containing protein [Coriobacteriia bacterium]
MLTVSQSAKILGVTPSRVRALIADGKLPAEKAGGVWLLNETDVVARLQSAPTGGRPRKEDPAEFAPRDWGRVDEEKIRRIRALYAEARELLLPLITVDESAALGDYEIQRFASAVSDFFLQRKQEELIQKGVF